METGATILVEQIKTSKRGDDKTTQQASVYDIFISYSHKNTQQATGLFEKLQDQDPNLKIFFDNEELKTGKHDICVSHI